MISRINVKNIKQVYKTIRCLGEVNTTSQKTQTIFDKSGRNCDLFFRSSKGLNRSFKQIQQKKSALKFDFKKSVPSILLKGSTSYTPLPKELKPWSSTSQKSHHHSKSQFWPLGGAIGLFFLLSTLGKSKPVFALEEEKRLSWDELDTLAKQLSIDPTEFSMDNPDDLECACFEAILKLCQSGDINQLKSIDVAALAKLRNSEANSLLLAAMKIQAPNEAIRHLHTAEKRTRGVSTDGDSQGNTPLHYAAEQGRLDLIEDFRLTYGSYRNHNNETALHVAIRCDQEAFLKRACELHMPQNNFERGDEALTLLGYAVKYGSKKSALFLAKRNGFREVPKYRTVLHVAVEYGQTKMIELFFDEDHGLIETAKPLLSGGDRQHRTPFSFACWKGKKEPVIELHKLGTLHLNSKHLSHCDTIDSYTPTHWAAEGLHPAIILLLYSWGAPTDWEDKRGRRPEDLCQIQWSEPKRRKETLGAFKTVAEAKRSNWKAPPTTPLLKTKQSQPMKPQVGNMDRLIDEYQELYSNRPDDEQSDPLEQKDRSLASQLGRLCIELGQFERAIGYFTSALREQEEKCENALHEGVADALEELGDAHFVSGQHEEALQTYERLLKYQCRLYNRVTFSTASDKEQSSLHLLPALSRSKIINTLNRIGETNRLLGRFALASTQFKEALDLDKEYCNNPLSMNSHVFRSIRGLGYTLIESGEYKKSISYLRKCLFYSIEKVDLIWMSEVPLSNRDKAEIQSALGTAYLRSGDASTAIQSFKKAKAFWETLSTDRSRRAIAHLSSSLGEAYYLVGEYNKAIASYKEALDIQDSADNWNNLGAVYRAENNYLRAIVCFQNALKASRTNKKRAGIALTLCNLGSTEGHMGNLARSTSLFKEALQIQREIYGEKDPSIAHTLDALSAVLERGGKFKEALQYSLESLEMKKGLYSESHTEFADTLDQLGVVYCDLGMYEEALNTVLLALRIRSEIIQERPAPSLADSYHSLGRLYNRKGEFKKAIKANTTALEMRQGLYEAPHADIARSLCNLGISYSHSGAFDRGVATLKKSIKMFNEVYQNRPHPYTMIALNALGSALMRAGNPRDGLNQCLKALEGQRKIYGEEQNVRIATTLDNIGCIYSALKNPTNSIPCFEKALAICIKTVGPTHPFTLEIQNNLEREKKKLPPPTPT